MGNRGMPCLPHFLPSSLSLPPLTGASPSFVMGQLHARLCERLSSEEGPSHPSEDMERNVRSFLENMRVLRETILDSKIYGKHVRTSVHLMVSDPQLQVDI